MGGKVKQKSQIFQRISVQRRGIAEEVDRNESHSSEEKDRRTIISLDEIPQITQINIHFLYLSLLFSSPAPFFNCFLVHVFLFLLCFFFFIAQGALLMLGVSDK